MIGGAGYGIGIWSQLHRPVPIALEDRFDELVEKFEEDDEDFELVVPGQSIAAAGMLLGFAGSGLVFLRRGWPQLITLRRRIATTLIGLPTTLAVVAVVSPVGGGLLGTGAIGASTIAGILYALIPLHVFVLVPFATLFLEERLLACSTSG